MNNKPFSRAERVSQQVLKTINEIISRDLDLRKYGFITFSSVKMTSDLKHANLYYSVINPKMNLEKVTELTRKITFSDLILDTMFHQVFFIFPSSF